MKETNRITSVVLIPSLYCNLRCDHCLRSAGPHRRERMQRNVMRAIRRMLREHKPTDLTISGGEPFVWNEELWDNILWCIEGQDWENIYIATNGTFTQRRLDYVTTRLVPYLINELAWYGRLTITLSRDQFHYPGKVDWATFQALLENEYRRAVQVTQGHPHLPMVLPLGRAQKTQVSFTRPRDVSYCNFDGWDHQYHNQLTIYPDGRVSACCDGGAWCGNILYQDPEEIVRNRRRFLFHMRRRFSYPTLTSGVPIAAACPACRREGRQYFGTSFKEQT